MLVLMPQEMTWGLARLCPRLVPCLPLTCLAALCLLPVSGTCSADVNMHEVLLQTMQCSAFLAGMFHSGLMRYDTYSHAAYHVLQLCHVNIH